MKSSRYIRQEVLPDFGASGQLALSNSKVLIIGMGGLGCPVSSYLNAMGVGKLVLADHDRVSSSNLHRQVLYNTNDTGKLKVEVAKLRLKAQNPDTVIDIHSEGLHLNNVVEIMSGVDLAMDCSDNFGTRYLVNDACVDVGIPFISGSLFRHSGQVGVFNHNGSGTYRCMYPEQSSQETLDCNAAGVLGVLPGIIGCCMAMEAIKLLAGLEELLINKVKVYDLMSHNEQLISYTTVTKNTTPNQLKDEYTLPKCSSINMITPEAFSKRKDLQKLTILDVRDEHEIDDMINGAINIPLHQLTDKLHSIDSTIETIVICKSGLRSHMACEILTASGFTHVLSLEGGMDNYQSLIGC